MKLKTSPSRECCSHSHENLLHLLYQCPRTENFWQMVIAWWIEERSQKVASYATDILYGYKPESNLFQALTVLLLLQNITSFFHG